MALRGLPDRHDHCHTPVMYDKALPLRAVSLRRCLEDWRRDPASGVPLGPASAALRYLLPVYDLERNTPASTSPLQETFDRSLRQTWMACHVTGSSIERLSVPPYTERPGGRVDGGQPPLYRIADVDMMVELKQLQVAARRGGGRFYMDTARASHRGYTRVGFDKSGLTQEELSGPFVAFFVKDILETDEEEEKRERKEEREYTDEREKEGKNDIGCSKTEGKQDEKKTGELEEKSGDGGDRGKEKGGDKEKKGGEESKEQANETEEGREEEEKDEEEKKEKVAGGTENERESPSYLSIDASIAYLANELAANTAADTQVNRQGPAINIQQLLRRKQDDPGGAHDFVEDCDLVPALPLAEQPAELADWLERVRGCRWPTEPLRAEIGRSGRCFLVGAGHASSARRDLEWRLSFSEPERRLALSLTPQQRKVYVLIKMMQKCYLQQPKVLVTYHIKTLMFWEMECGNIDWSEEELFSSLLAMLDRIQGCLERHYIPSYFMPDNNLISHASAEDVAAALSTVRQIRHQPLRHLYGIDDRFRFDFSPRRPLSELHAPLLETITRADGEGGGDAVAVAEALVLSLISQAQADIHHGLTVMEHCVDLLRDAWEALAVTVPEGAPHPVHGDWAVFATAAVLTSMEADESSHLTMAIRMAVQNEKRPPTARQMTEEEAQVFSSLITPMLGGSNGQLDQIMQQTNTSGVLPEQPPVEHMLSVRHAQLELLRDLKNRAEEQLAGPPPMSAAVTSTRLQLGLLELTYRLQRSGGVSEPDARLQVFMQMLSMTQSLLGTGGSAPGDLRVMIGQTLAVLGMPDGVNATMQAALTPEVDQMCQQLTPAAADPKRLAFEKDPKITALIPLDMIQSFQHCIFGQGFSEEVADLRYTAFLNMMGFFLKQRHHLFAFRMVGRLTCLRLAALEAEMTRSVFDLSRARLYLQQLPEPVHTLLRLSSCRATIGVVYYFIDFVHLTFDWTLMTELTMRPAEDLPKMKKIITDAAPSAPADVLLTHQLMLLCALRVLGRETAECLRVVASLGGEAVAEQAAAVLAGWRPIAAPPPLQTDGQPASSQDSSGGDMPTPATTTDGRETDVRD